MQMLVNLSDADLLARMKNFEDHLVERKTVSDEKDWKKTAVAFANSAPVGLPAVLFIGVRDNGEIETPQKNLDEAQKRFNNHMKRVYPRIAYVPKIIADGDGKQALAVIIPGSELRPHFTGLSYIRRGSESIEASEEQFGELIAQGNSKAARILQWKGQNISVFSRNAGDEISWPNTTVLVGCDQFYVTVQIVSEESPLSFPLSRVEINFDNARNRLQLEILGPQRSAWDVEMERHVRQVVTYEMTAEGRLLLKSLLLHGKLEAHRPFIEGSSIEVQHKQMEIAIQNQMVTREQDQRRLHNYYAINPEFFSVLKKVLPQIRS